MLIRRIGVLTSGGDASGMNAAVRAIVRGAFRRLFWIGALGLGGLVPLALFAVAATSGLTNGLIAAIALTALVGGFVWEYIWVEAGQSVPLS